MAVPRKVSKPAAKPVPAVSIPTPVAPVVERSEVKGSGKPKIPTVAAVAVVRMPTHAAIQRRAYEIYAGRGYAAGDAAADWHEAERQLKAGL